MDVTLVIPTYGRPAALLQTLEALLALDYPRDRWEAVVVDDGSPQEVEGPVLEWIARNEAQVRLFRQSNAGPSAARNRGAAEATGRVLIFIDNDILVEPDFVHRHLTALEENPRCWIVGRVVQPEQLRETPFGRYRDQLHERFHRSFEVGKRHETIWITTQNLSMPRADFQALGGFDEGFTIASSEDWELGCRAREQGIRMLYDGAIVVRHNDWAVDLERFCERQRTYSLSDVLLWRKYGGVTPRESLIVENAAIVWGKDGPKRTLKKAAKILLASRIGRASLFGLCRAAEKICPDTRFNHRAYELAIAAAIFRGVRTGLRRYPDPVERAPAVSALPASETQNVSVSVIIPTHNRKQNLLATLETLTHIDYDGVWEVIVVDDGSTDGTEEAVREWGATRASFRCIRQANAGPASARNRGATEATGDVLVFLDDDIEVTPRFLTAHVSALLHRPGSWVTGRITHPEELRSTPFGRYRHMVWERFHTQHPPTGTTPTEGGSAANLAVWSADFRRLGGFDESFTTPSSEDWDLGIRARHEGICVLYDPQNTAIHSDWAAVSLDKFCERQHTYSVADVLLWRKYGDASPRRTVIHRNAPIDWRRDGLLLIWRKCMKRLLATRLGGRVVKTLCSGAERMAPDTSLSRWAYDVAVAVAIFRGVREGMNRFPVEKKTGARPTAPQQA